MRCDPTFKPRTGLAERARVNGETRWGCVKEAVAPNRIGSFAAIARQIPTDGFVRSEVSPPEGFGFTQGAKNKDSFGLTGRDGGLCSPQPVSVTIEIDQ